MKRILPLVLLLASSALQAADLTVSAAVSLTESFREIAAAYEKAHPDTKVNLNFAGSGVLVQQIARGAPVDVFAAADQDTMDQAAGQGLLAPGSRQVFAGNSLWVVIPARSSRRPATLSALASAGIERVAIGNPDSVPAGRYARAALQAAGLWPAVQAKMISTQNVRQALDYVARGEVDAGFVYATDAQAMSSRVQRAYQVPVPGGIRYPLAQVKDSGNPAAARSFIQFVRSPQGQAILQRHGFGSP